MLELPDASGVTLRKQLEQVQKSTKTRDKRLDSVLVPRGVEYLWERFWELCNGAPPSLTDIKAYADMTRWDISRFEFDAIGAMGREYALVLDERMREKKPGG